MPPGLSVPLSLAVRAARGLRSALWVPPTVAGSYETNLTVSSRIGTTITAGATANSKTGAVWANLIAATGKPSYGVYFAVSGIAVSAAIQSFLLDLAIGAAGSEQTVWPNLNASEAGGIDLGPTKMLFLPIYIPSGARLSCRGQASTASDTCLVAVWLCQDVLYPWTCGQVTDYGTDLTVSDGTTVTPDSGAFGSWVELLNPSGGSGLVRPHRFWTALCGRSADTTWVGAGGNLLELGVGPSIASVTTLGQLRWWHSGSEEMGSIFPLFFYAPMIVDATNRKLFARLASGTTEAFRVSAYGMD